MTSTGLAAGSGGTGLQPGAGGSGVAGGGGGLNPPQVLLEGFGASSTYVSPAVTAPENESTFLLFVQEGNENSQTPIVADATVEGMGLEWQRRIASAIDTSGTWRSAMYLWTAIGVATDGPLTIVPSRTSSRVAAVLIAVDGVNRIAFSADGFATGVPLSIPLAVPENVSSYVIGANATNWAKTLPGEPVLDAGWDEIAWSGTHQFGGAVKVGVADLDVSSFDVAGSPQNHGSIVVGMTAGIPSYGSVIAGLNPTVHYPLATLTSEPDIADFDTHLAASGLAVTSRYPLQVTGAAPDPDSYDTTNAGLAPLWQIDSSLGVGTPLPSYDTTNAALAPLWQMAGALQTDADLIENLTIEVDSGGGFVEVGATSFRTAQVLSAVSLSDDAAGAPRPVLLADASETAPAAPATVTDSPNSPYVRAVLTADVSETAPAAPATVDDSLLVDPA